MNPHSSPHVLPDEPAVPPALLAAVEADYDRFARQGPISSLAEHLLDRYELDLRTEYAGVPLANPWGKASGQLSMTSRQVQDDIDAGLGFVVLKTVIAQDQAGDRSMRAWAVKESRMDAERIAGRSGETGWTISWKGRGWWQSFDEYLDLVRASQQMAAGTQTLIVPSCKYHLPTPDEGRWRTEEYEHTTRRLLDAWRGGGDADARMPLEKDFSPTLAGSDLARVREQILEWLRTVPRLVRAAAGREATLGMKLFNALFDDEFQLDMLRTIHAEGDSRPDFFIYGNRLFDPEREFDGHRGIAYGGPDLSDRNLRVMGRFQQELDMPGFSPLPWSATGNICSGKMALEYALRGASSFQLHTFFQLPAGQYRMKSGSKTQKALHELHFHPRTGLIVWMHHLAAVLDPPRPPIRLRDVIGHGPL
ncbi:MAG: hypothetical protein ACREJB_07025 [Planctomycetaceae bacterium]